MPDLAAPFLTPDELTARPGDPALGGVRADYDPANKNPLGALQQSFDRIDAENMQAMEAARQRQFQKAQQARQQQHDLLTRQMEYENQEKLLRQRKAWENQKMMYDMFSSTGGTSHTVTGPDGKSMGIPFRADDQEIADNFADELRKKAFGENATNYLYSGDMVKDQRELNRLNTNMSLRAVYDAQARQDLSKASMPEMKQAAQDYLNYLESTRADSKTPPRPYVSPFMSAKPNVDVAVYQDPKKLESFEGGMGIPNRVYAGFENTTDANELNQGYNHFQHFQASPEGQSPQEYAAYQQSFNDLRKARGQQPIDLGGVLGQDGKIHFDDSTPAKRITLARKFLTAYNQLQTGHLQLDPDAEKDKLEQEKTKAAIAKDNIEIALKKKELETGKDGKKNAEEIKDERDIKAVKSTYKDVRKVFDEKPTYVSQATKMIMSANGIDPAKYNISIVPSGKADKFIGIEAPEEDVTIAADKKTPKKTIKGVKGQSVKPDAVFMIEDKKSRNKELVFLKDGGIVARANEKDALINGLKHDARYDQKQYENKVAHAEDVFETAASKTIQSDEDAIRKRLVPITIKSKDGKLIHAMKDPVTNKRYAL